MNVPEQDSTNDLLKALATWDVVDTFQALPLYDQDKFVAWITRAPDEEAYRRRIDILVLGMRMAPLTKAKPTVLPEQSDFWTNPIGRDVRGELG